MIYWLLSQHTNEKLEISIPTLLRDVRFLTDNILCKCDGCLTHRRYTAVLTNNDKKSRASGVDQDGLNKKGAGDSDSDRGATSIDRLSKADSASLSAAGRDRRASGLALPGDWLRPLRATHCRYNAQGLRGRFQSSGILLLRRLLMGGGSSRACGSGSTGNCSTLCGTTDWHDDGRSYPNRWGFQLRARRCGTSPRRLRCC